MKTKIEWIKLANKYSLSDRVFLDSGIAIVIARDYLSKTITDRPMFSNTTDVLSYYKTTLEPYSYKLVDELNKSIIVNIDQMLELIKNFYLYLVSNTYNIKSIVYSKLSTMDNDFTNLSYFVSDTVLKDLNVDMNKFFKAQREVLALLVRGEEDED